MKQSAIKIIGYVCIACIVVIVIVTVIYLLMKIVLQNDILINTARYPEKAPSYPNSNMYYQPTWYDRMTNRFAIWFYGVPNPYSHKYGHGNYKHQPYIVNNVNTNINTNPNTITQPTQTQSQPLMNDITNSIVPTLPILLMTQSSDESASLPTLFSNVLPEQIPIPALYGSLTLSDINNSMTHIALPAPDLNNVPSLQANATVGNLDHTNSLSSEAIAIGEPTL